MRAPANGLTAYCGTLDDVPAAADYIRLVPVFRTLGNLRLDVQQLFEVGFVHDDHAGTVDFDQPFPLEMREKPRHGFTRRADRFTDLFVG